MKKNDNKNWDCLNKALSDFSRVNCYNYQKLRWISKKLALVLASFLLVTETNKKDIILK